MKKILNIFNSYSRILIGIFFIAKKQNTIFLLYILNLILNVILKLFIRQKRPPGSYHKTYGMPSGHAQAIGFFLISQIINKNKYWPLIFIYSLQLLHSRIIKQHHTYQQVIIGYLLGIITGYYSILMECFPLEW
jgi:membrane-associated phospholipid phosphatase